MKIKKLPSQREAVILSILLNGEKYGREIRNEYEELTSRKLPFGSLYTTLSRMEEYGYILSRMGKPNTKRGGNRRKYFELTGMGQQSLDSFKLFVAGVFGGKLKARLS